jgi:hypothetical protein
LSIITVLLFAGIPAAVFLVVAGLVYAGSARRGKRYRPGRPFEFAPVWFLSAPESLALDGGSGGGHAIASGRSRAELPAGAGVGPAATDEQGVAERSHDVTGGASDRW